jgi:hypothetical protein
VVEAQGNLWWTGDSGNRVGRLGPLDEVRTRQLDRVPADGDGDHRETAAGPAEIGVLTSRGNPTGTREDDAQCERAVGQVVDLQLRRATGRAERDREVHPVTSNPSG